VAVLVPLFRPLELCTRYAATGIVPGGAISLLSILLPCSAIDGWRSGVLGGAMRYVTTTQRLAGTTGPVESLVPVYC
jgi:hypothetical protein